MKTLFNKARTEETTAFIAAELRTLLDRNELDSYMSRRIREACPAYRNGLTNGERVLATSLALAAVQGDVTRALASLEYETAYWDEDDEAA